ncbi:MAG: sigma-70 family RNA polymerase sigma factor [Acidobacteriia bacterium]|nr:sigma-70 family RNA polymerase sigma factor [Terriglobia bacterium]
MELGFLARTREVENRVDTLQPALQPALATFEAVVLPHLDAAYNLARWLARNEQDAEDVVQEAYLRAFRFFDGYRGGDGKAWVLEIVRNTYRSWLRRQSRYASAEPFDEMAHSGDFQVYTQEDAMTSDEERSRLRSCLEKLPEEFREVLVLRELEEMSYREISETSGLAIGTVMSRLSRARKRLEQCVRRYQREAAR